MNLGSVVVLAIVIAIVALAIRSVFFKKTSRCCSECGTSCKDCPAHNVKLDPGQMACCHDELAKQK